MAAPPVLLALFFASGFAGLMYELLWVRELALVFGNTAQSAATTLAVFFLGLSAGQRIAGRRAAGAADPLRVYAVLEALVAASASTYFAVLPLYGALAPALFAWTETGAFAATAARVAFAAGALLALCLCMGATLPVMGHLLVRRADALAPTFGVLYAVQTIGGALGALAAGFWLPGLIGFRRTYLLAMGLSAGVAGLAYLASRAATARKVPTPESAVGTVRAHASNADPRHRLAVGIACVSGFAALAVEVLWTHMFSQALHNSVYSFAAILVTFLVALGIGSLLAAALARAATRRPLAPLAVLLAYWADQPLSDKGRRLLRGRGGGRLDLETALGMLPALAMIAVAVAGLTWGAGLLHWLRAGPGAAGAVGPLRPWLVPYALIGAGAIAFVIFGRRLPARLRSRWLGTLVAVDLVVFTILCVVAVLPGLGRGPGPGGGAAAAAGRGGQAATALPSAHPGGPAAGPATGGPRPVAALGYPGRFAIYDPDQAAAHELPLLGAPDLNAISATPSVQGYTSLVDGFYAAATGAHQAMGQGQDVLAPRAVGDGTLDQLNTSVLLTPPAYLITAAGGAGSRAGDAGSRAWPPAGPPGTGRRDIAAGHRATWYFAAPLRVSRLEVPDADARQDAAAGTQIGLMTAGGLTRWFAASAPRASRLAITLPRPVTGVAVVAQAGGRPSQLGPLSITDTDGNVFVADGQLQDALVPPRWGYAGHDGSFAVFVDRLARGPLSLQALPGRPAAGASVRRVSGPAAGPTAAAVSSPHGIRVIRSVTAIAGWSATWHPRHGPPVTLAVGRAGLVQAVDVPPGTGMVTWRYLPPWFPAGFALSLAAALILVLLAGCAACARRPRRPAADPGERGRAAPGQGGSMVCTDK